MYLKISFVTCVAENTHVYSSANISHTDNSNVEGAPALQPSRTRGAGAAVRAADASLRDGGDAEGAAQGRQHQAALRLALHGDRCAGETRRRRRERDLARGQPARAHSL